MKKIVLILLSMVMIITVFTACSKGNNADITASTSNINVVDKSETDNGEYTFYVTGDYRIIQTDNRGNTVDITEITEQYSATETDDLILYKNRLYFCNKLGYISACGINGKDPINTRLYLGKISVVNDILLGVFKNHYLLGINVENLYDNMDLNDESIISYKDYQNEDKVTDIWDYMVVKDWIYYYIDTEENPKSSACRSNRIFRIRLDGTDDEELVYGFFDTSDGYSKNGKNNGYWIEGGYTHVWTVENGIIYVLTRRLPEHTFGLLKIDGNQVEFIRADGETNTEENLESAEKMLDEHTPNITG